jgi:diguanylate cyclase (GGDEF)-like protein
VTQVALRLGTSRLALLFGFALVVALSVFAAVALETYAIEGKLGALRRAVEIADAQRDSVLALVDQERGVRGYVATGDPQFLQSYRAGLRLEAATPVFDPVSARSFPQLAERSAASARAAKDLQDYFAATIADVRRGRRDLAIASLKEGKRKFDVFEQRDAAVRSAVAGGLDRVEVDADAAIRNALAAGLVGIVVLTVASNFIIVELVAERRVERLAERDALTGLANRRYFQTQVERALARYARDGAPFALIYLDVDDFKSINDAYSHLVGDEVLQSIATRLSASIRVDDIAARLGGDEFAVLLSGVPGDETSPAAERLAEELAGPHRFPQLAVDVSCSFGTSSCPGDGADFKTLVLRADERMLERKRKRRRARQAFPERRRQERPGGARQPPT